MLCWLFITGDISMKALNIVLLALAGLIPSYALADAPGRDPAILAHIVRAGEINATLLEAEKRGGFDIVLKRDNVTHRYTITRTMHADTICYRHETWPGSGDRCEFRAEMAARFARDWTIFVR